MTKSNLLERKKQSIEAKKNKLKQLESHVKTMERKTRTRRLIELGGLVAKAGLEDLESNTLLGGLLNLKQLVADPDERRVCSSRGSGICKREPEQVSRHREV
ncbi:MAG: conjugal transfer protein TraD [Candidatus Nucleicultricaceae bacterium]